MLLIYHSMLIIIVFHATPMNMKIDDSKKGFSIDSGWLCT